MCPVLLPKLNSSYRYSPSLYARALPQLITQNKFENSLHVVKCQNVPLVSQYCESISGVKNKDYVNQDSWHFTNNFLGLQNITLAYVCDGHGKLGGIVSNFIVSHLESKFIFRHFKFRIFSI
jgi:hypothetical protein